MIWSAVVRQTPPQPRFRSGLHGMSPDPHDARAIAALGSRLAKLEEEVHAPRLSRHGATPVSKNQPSGETVGEVFQHRIKAPQMKSPSVPDVAHLSS